MAQMVRAMRAILGMESLGSYFVVSSSLSNEEVGQRLDVINRQPTLEDEIEALEVCDQWTSNPVSLRKFFVLHLAQTIKHGSFLNINKDKPAFVYRRQE